MPQVVARMKVKNKHYEILVDLDEAMKIRESKGGNIVSAVISNSVQHDMKQGISVSNADLMDAFGTTDLYEVAKKIIMSGEVQKTQEVRDAERDAKVKQVVNLVLKNASDQHGHPYTEERIRRAIEEAHYHIDNRAPEQQLTELIAKLQTIIPIKMETKKIKLIIPARFTGQVYGLLKEFKESEEWLSNGDLQAIINIPAGMQIDFYDRLNAITHGAVRSEDVVEKK